MENRFFPNDEARLGFVMRIFEEEIDIRYDWIKDGAKRLNEAMNENSASSVINNGMVIINHAMMVLRLVDVEAIGSRNPERSKERARILHERNPYMPEPPMGLRIIRNDFEHFEDRLDEWATGNNPTTYIDLNVGGGIFVEGAQKKDVFRQLEGTTLSFWNNEVDLQEVVAWSEEMSSIVTRNNRTRL